MQGRTSMTLCAKALFLAAGQMKKLYRSERALMASIFYVKSPCASHLTWPLAYVESPEKCSTREAFSMLRSLPRKHRSR